MIDFELPYDLHIIRSDDWPDASKNPITKSEIDALVEADRELSWSETSFVDLTDRETGEVVRHNGIVWKGLPCFWWWRGEVTCASPDEAHIAKMIKMAAALGARVVGDDGERYELRRSFLGKTKVVFSGP